MELFLVSYVKIGYFSKIRQIFQANWTLFQNPECAYIQSRIRCFVGVRLTNWLIVSLCLCVCVCVCYSDKRTHHHPDPAP